MSDVIRFPTKSAQQLAYERKGAAAFRAGVPRYSNPYRADTKRAAWWGNGWLDAQAEWRKAAEGRFLSASRPGVYTRNADLTPAPSRNGSRRRLNVGED